MEADCRGVLVVERLAEVRAPGERQAARGAERRRQRRHGEVDRGPGDAGLGQGFGGEHDQLGVRAPVIGAHELHADLGELAFGAQLGAGDPQHFAGIAEPQRPRRLLQPRGGDARDLRGDVGPEAHHALGQRVHQAEGLGGHRRAGPAQQAVLELDQRRLDALIAVGREMPHQPLDDLGLVFGMGRQNVAQPGGQQRAVGGPGHRAGGVRTSAPAPGRRRAAPGPGPPRRRGFRRRRRAARWRRRPAPTGRDGRWRC